MDGVDRGKPIYVERSQILQGMAERVVILLMELLGHLPKRIVDGQKADASDDLVKGLCVESGSRKCLTKFSHGHIAVVVLVQQPVAPVLLALVLDRPFEGHGPAQANGIEQQWNPQGQDILGVYGLKPLLRATQRGQNMLYI